MKSVAIISQIGNFTSVKNAFDRIGSNVTCLVDPPLHNDSALTHLVLPGVGSFSEGMRRLRFSRWYDYLQDEWVPSSRPLLGICLGMQLLADEGDEGSDASIHGLGLVSGKILSLSELQTPRLPHIGWKSITPVNCHPIFNNIPHGSDFYFVHSYHFQVASPRTIIARTDYGDSFTSAVASDHIVGVQFHPEKSQSFGRQLLENFLRL